VTLELRRDGAPPLRIGHRGAPALAPENTLESLARALEHQLDLVELDVVATQDGELVLGHSYAVRELTHGAARGSARRRTLADLRTLAPDLPTLDKALGLLTEKAPDVGVQLDLKEAGYEERALDALRRHGLLERAFVSSYFPSSLRAAARLEPRLPLALTYPQDRFGVARWRALLPAIGVALLAFRQALPYRIGRWIRVVGASVASLNWRVVSPALLARCQALDVEVYAWTVNDPALARRLVEAGLDGIITDDPRIFDGF
jgi:glycerophosphoryl diester phosphodiesterase